MPVKKRILKGLSKQKGYSISYMNNTIHTHTHSTLLEEMVPSPASYMELQNGSI